MKSKSQKQIVIDKLKSDGEITNLFCITNGIWRLSDIILHLRRDGYKIEGGFIEGTKNYKYSMTDFPKKTIEIIDLDSLPPVKIEGRWVGQRIIRREVVAV